MGERLANMLVMLAFGAIGIALLAGLPIGLVAAAWLRHHGQPTQPWQAFAGVSACAWTVVIVAKSCDWSIRGAHLVASLLLAVPLLLSGAPLPVALLGWLALVVLFWLAQCAFGENHIIETIVIVAIMAGNLSILVPVFANAKAKAEASYRSRLMHAGDHMHSPR